MISVVKQISKINIIRKESLNWYLVLSSQHLFTAPLPTTFVQSLVDKCCQSRIYASRGGVLQVQVLNLEYRQESHN